MYTVRITVGGCTSNPATTTVSVSSSQFPAEVEGVSFSSPTRLAWTPTGGSGTVSDVVRGLTNELPVGSGPSEACIASGVTGGNVTDNAVPAAGRSFWYLVRGRNSCGTGTYGTASDGTPRQTTVCP